MQMAFLLLLLLLLLAMNCDCEAIGTNDVPGIETDDAVDDAASSCEADSNSLRHKQQRVVRRRTVGTTLNDEARFPITLVGDWERVIAAPEVHIIADTSDVIFTEGPLVRNADDGSSCSSFVLYASDTVRAVIYRISLSSSEPTNDGNDDDEYSVEVWATHTGGIDDGNDNDVSHYEHLAEKGSNGMATDVLDPRFVIINQHGLRRVIRCRLDDHTQGAPLRDCPDLQVITDAFEDSALQDLSNGNDSNDNNSIVPEETKTSTVRRYKYNSPNDVVVHPHDGSIWFTDPIYGLLETDRFCDEFPCHTGESYLDKKSEIGWQGVYRVDRGSSSRNNNFSVNSNSSININSKTILETKEDDLSPSSVVQLITKYHRRPNGLGFTPDAKRLWVADSTIGSPSWTAYDLCSSSSSSTSSSSDSTRFHPSCDTGSKATDVLTPAALGTMLGRTKTLPPLAGGEGT